jgi:hypothetical protein
MLKSYKRSLPFKHSRMGFSSSSIHATLPDHLIQPSFDNSKKNMVKSTDYRDTNVVLFRVLLPPLRPKYSRQNTKELSKHNCLTMPDKHFVQYSLLFNAIINLFMLS